MKFMLENRLFLYIFLLLFSTSLSYTQASEPLKKSKRPKVGLVLSGGGAKGFAYIGMIKVMQEVGLPVDYVGGTSIGSIIAGLYAIGYHPDSIAKIIRSQNWDALLKDEIDLKYISYEEKEFGGMVLVTLPFKEKTVQLGASLYHGQEINMLLNRYFSPVYKITDFNKFQTPFLCIGTDLLDGKAITLNEGYLPMAIRASMSIPGYFSPTPYLGHYLVDGGVVNNYPVKEVKDLCADIIVGGDVQSGLHNSMDELNTITKVIDQITSYYRMEANKVGYELTDILVPIPMKYGMMDFESYDSIIAIGEKVARIYYDDLKALADSLNAIEYVPVIEYKTMPLKSIPINEVVVKGSEKMNASFFKSSFEDVAQHEVSFDVIEDKIRSLYGTKFFQYVFYELEFKDGFTNLIVTVEDADPGYLSAKVHYDNDYKGSILVSTAIRNVLGNRTKLFADIVLGSNPRLKALYMLDNGARPGFGIIADFYRFHFNQYKKDQKINSFDITTYKSSVFLNTTIRNTYSFRGGLEYEYTQFKQEIVVDSILENYRNFESIGNVFASINANTYNKYYFSTKGFRSELLLKYVVPLSKDWSQELFTSKLIIQLKYDYNLPLSRKFTLKPGFFLGATFDEVRTLESKKAPVQHWFAVGGLNPNNYQENHVSFTGVNFIQSFGYYAAIGRMKLQYQPLNKIYFTLLADAGVNERLLADVIEPKNLMVGYGATASYNSFVGPVELTVMGSNINSGVGVYLNIGFWF